MRGLRAAQNKGPQPRLRLGALRRRPAARCSPALLGAVPSPRGPLTAVFGKGTGVETPPRPPVRKIGNWRRKDDEDEGKPEGVAGARRRARRVDVQCFIFAPGPSATRRGGGRSGQAARPIRTGLLRPSRALRTRPVYPVVFRGPSACSRTGTDDLRGGLALRCLQRLSRCGVATRRCP